MGKHTVCNLNHLQLNINVQFRAQDNVLVTHKVILKNFGCETPRVLAVIALHAREDTLTTRETLEKYKYMYQTLKCPMFQTEDTKRSQK